MSRGTAGSAAAYGSATLAWLYALVSAYWAAGGTALLSTVGGSVEDLARRGGATAALVAGVTVLLKLAGGVVGLALVQPWGRRLPQRPLRLLALVAGSVLGLWGGLNVVLGGLALLGVFGTPADASALRWHVGLWDLWFLVWGLLLLAAVLLLRAPAEPVGGAE